MSKVWFLTGASKGFGRAWAPGGFSTDWSGPSSMHSDEIAAYADVRAAAANRPSLRVFFGSAPLGIATKDYESRLATWNEWQPVSEQAQGS